MDQSIGERWLPVVGYEGFYEVSDLGRVRSVERLVPNGHGRMKRMKAKMMTCTGWETQRYLFVSLCRDGKPRRLTVHRLVLEAFVGLCPDGMETCHGEGGAFDNRLVNLRWGTRETNCADKWEQDAMPHGERHHRARLTAEDVVAIRADPRSHSAVASDYGVSKSAVSLARLRINWKWLD